MKVRQSKCWGLTLLCLLVIVILPHTTYAADDLYLSSCSPVCSISNTVVSGAANGTVTVNVIADFPQSEQGIVVNLTYDPTELTYTGVTNGSVISGWSAPVVNLVSSSGNTAVENFQFSANSPAGAVAPGAGTLQIATVTFTVNASPSSGSSVLNLSAASFVNVDYSSPATPTLNNGSFLLQYQLTSNISGSGTVLCAVSGFNCSTPAPNAPVSCPTPTYVSVGSSIELCATALTGNTLSSWQVTGSSPGSDCGTPSSGSCTISSMSAATTVLATFNLQGESIAAPAASPSAGASSVTCAVTIGGANCSGATVNYGAGVTFTEVPQAGYTFSGWAGTGLNCSNGTTNSTCVVTAVDVSITSVTANYTVQTESIATPTASPSAGASSVTCAVTVGGANCAGATVNYGTGVTFTEVPQAGYTFTGWTGTGLNCSNGNTNSTCVVTAVDASITSVTANYTVQTESIATPVASPSGGASVTCVVTTGGANCTGTSVNYGTGVTFTEVTNSGYNFTGWSGSGLNCSNGTTSSTCIVTAVDAPISSVTANFTQNYTIIAGGTSGSGSTGGNIYCPTGNNPTNACPLTVTPGAQLTFAATPNKGALLGSWTVTGTVAGTCSNSSNSCTLTINGNLNISASFSPFYGDVLGHGAVDYGDVVAAEQAYAQYSVGGQSAITVPNFIVTNAQVNAGSFSYGDVIKIKQYEAGVSGITL